jgi:alpha-tubulin suppressor-like RCC1 family protein
MAAGDDHNLALSWDGRVYSWGDNSSGQLGHGDVLDRSSPVPMEGLEGVCSIAASAYHSFALTSLGGVHLWGASLIDRGGGS